MGIRTKITIYEANALLKNLGITLKTLKPTVDGISDSVYKCSDNFKKEYILKIYESASVEDVRIECDILETLSSLPIPKCITKKEDILKFQGKPAALFSCIKGSSPKNITIEHSKQIGEFLGKFHFLSKNIAPIYPKRDLKNEIENILDKIEVSCDIDRGLIKEFKSRYKIVKEVDLSANCLIHGDLFLDNANFIEDKLSGVFDFIECRYANAFFDLSVALNSWCFDNEYKILPDFLDALLDGYNRYSFVKADYKSIKTYMLFASLYYALKRFHTQYIEKRDIKKDYKEFIKKYDRVL